MGTHGYPSLHLGQRSCWLGCIAIGLQVKMTAPIDGLPLHWQTGHRRTEQEYMSLNVRRSNFCDGPGL